MIIINDKIEIKQIYSGRLALALSCSLKIALKQLMLPLLLLPLLILYLLLLDGNDETFPFKVFTENFQAAGKKLQEKEAKPPMHWFNINFQIRRKHGQEGKMGAISPFNQKSLA